MIDLPYRWRRANLTWSFTDQIRSAATVEYLLRYDPKKRTFVALRYSRTSHWERWTEAREEVSAADTETLRAMLTPEDIAACAAASIASQREEDADA